MCVEGLRAVPLGCSDCYDKDRIPEACAWLARPSRLWWLGWCEAGAGPGAGARTGPGRLSLWYLAQHQLEE